MAKYYSFEDYYEIAKEYYEKNGNLLVSPFVDIEKDGLIYHLGIWVKRQRNRKQNNLLTLEKIKRLESIGMVWVVREYSWSKMYKYLKKFYEENHHSDVNGNYSLNIDGIEVLLGSWVNNQRRFYQEGRLSKEQIALLEQLHFNWKIYNEWETIYLLAKEYFETHGNLFIPLEYEVLSDGKVIKLGYWIRNQRRFYLEGSLSLDRKKLLEQIGILELKTAQKEKKLLSLLEEYKKKNGNTDVPYTHVIIENGYNYNLGYWVKRLREKYISGQLSDDLINKLNALSFNFNKVDSYWNIMYSIAKRYYEEYGNLKVVRDYKAVYQGNIYRLGYWIESQRELYRKMLLDERCIKLLNDIHMLWRINRIYLSWNDAYQLAKRYYETYGNINITDENCRSLGIDYRLKIWVRRQAKNLKDGKLTDDQKDLLDKIGLKESFNDFKWNKMYHIFIRCIEEYKKKDFPCGFIYTVNNEKYDIGSWINKQKKLYQDGKLQSNREALLKELLLPWLSDYEDDWNHGFLQALKYYNDNQSLDISFDYVDNDGYELGRWIMKQKEDFQKGILSKDKIKRLNSINYFFENSNDTERLIMICREYGIDYFLNKKIIDLNTPLILLKKIKWLLMHRRPLIDDNKLDPIFKMNNIKFEKLYDELMEKLLLNAKLKDRKK